MARIWTPAQTSAIEVRGKDLLVSAAAGSGKTATLTERIIRQLTDKESPADISKMLIVTFTRAAAAELRQRIFSAVTEALAQDPSNRHLSAQLVKIGNAKICTIDSFYLDLIRENFSSLGLPPAFRIADTAECELLSKDVMADTVNRFYDADPDGFSRFTEAFSSVRSSERLPDVFLNLYSHVSSYPEGVEFLRARAESCAADAELDFFVSSFGKILKDDTAECVSYFISVLSDAVERIADDEDAAVSYLASFSYDLTFCRDLRDILERGSYADARAHLLSYSPIKLKTLKGEAAEAFAPLKERRSAITKAIRALGSKSFALTHENICTAMKDTAQITTTLYRLLADFEKKLKCEKHSRAICDFNDIRRYALTLLVSPDGSPTEIAKNIAEGYTDIYIDEYQDVDRVQDMIFRAVSNGSNRFMVGDIKQSIYGFRGAEPQVFAGYRAAFPAHGSDNAEDSACEAIFMSNNFRCDENIIKFTNAVCSYLFGICAENIGYCPDDDLVFSKLPPEQDYISPKVTLSVITPPEDEDSEYVSNSENNKYSEAKYIAAKISELLATGRKADGSPIRPCDVAVLFRSGNMKPYLRRALDEAGIGYSGADNDKYFENPDVLLMLSILNVIDNPHRDIYLAGALHSPMFDISLDELVTLRGACDPSYSLYDAVCEYKEQNDDALAKKCCDFLSELDAWRDMTLSLPVDKLLKNIYSSRRFSAAGLADSENLRMLYEYARRFESGAFRGLYNFIEYLNRIIAEGTKFDVAAGDSSPDKISLMTIHHSKGLEFPVCFICGTAGEFNRAEFRDSLIFDYSAGVAMKIPDTTGFARINTPMREAVARSILLAQTEEEMRVLYVGLTRAREMLYVTANTSKSRDKLLSDADARHAYPCKYTLSKCKSYLEWILAAIAQSDLSDICDVDFISADLIPELKKDFTCNVTDVTTQIDSDKADELKKKFDFRYAHSALSRIPAKISVSRLSPDVLDESADTLNMFGEEHRATVPAILCGEKGDTLSPAERGTATHLFLQFCDFERAKRQGVENELHRLIEERYIPESAADAVFADELERFLESELYERIKSAKRVIREQRFNILMPPSMFSKDESFIAQVGDELLAVQGVIDLIVIDKDDRLCLYDYKTDRLNAAERGSEAMLRYKMRELHAEQLSYYKTAVERLFGRPCDTVEIYSTYAGRTVSVI